MSTTAKPLTKLVNKLVKYQYIMSANIGDLFAGLSAYLLIPSDFPK